MGVTLSRKAVKGGIASDHVFHHYNVGPSLKNRVNVFIGLAGANLGLTACSTATVIPTCNTNDGFFPGATPMSTPSIFLTELNKNGEVQGSKVYSIWSNYDELIGGECIVWGKVTCRITGQTGEIQKNSKQWTHFTIRDNTGPDIIKWL